jgi:hypothetical protein
MSYRKRTCYLTDAERQELISNIDTSSLSSQIKFSDTQSSEINYDNKSEPINEDTPLFATLLSSVDLEPSKTISAVDNWGNNLVKKNDEANAAAKFLESETIKKSRPRKKTVSSTKLLHYLKEYRERLLHE